MNLDLAFGDGKAGLACTRNQAGRQRDADRARALDRLALLDCSARVVQVDVSFQVKLRAAFDIAEHAVDVLASHMGLEEEDGGEANSSRILVIVYILTTTLVTPELQFAVLALDMSSECACRVETSIAAVISAYIG